VKVGDIVKVKKGTDTGWLHVNPNIRGKLAIIVVDYGKYDIDVRIFENNSKHRIHKQDCEVVSESESR